MSDGTPTETGREAVHALANTNAHTSARFGGAEPRQKEGAGFCNAAGRCGRLEVRVGHGSNFCRGEPRTSTQFIWEAVRERH